MHIDDLGTGWEEAERALQALQADLLATEPAAPKIVLLWTDEPREAYRQAFLGKSADWFFGANGGFELSREYVRALQGIAGQVQEAVADSMLGARKA